MRRRNFLGVLGWRSGGISTLLHGRNGRRKSMKIDDARRKSTKRQTAPKAARGRVLSIAKPQEQLDRVSPASRARCWSSRGRPPRCCKSSHPPSELQPVSMRYWQTLRAFAEAASPSIVPATQTPFERLPAPHDAPRAASMGKAARPAALPPPDALSLGRVATTKQVVHTSKTSDAKNPTSSVIHLSSLLSSADFERRLQYRDALKDNNLVGSINIFRQEVRMFTGKQLPFAVTLPRRLSSHRKYAPAQGAARPLEQQTARLPKCSVSSAVRLASLIQCFRSSLGMYAHS